MIKYLHVELNRAEIDFIAKAYIMLLITPYVTSGLSVLSLIFIFRKAFEGEGLLMGYMFGIATGYIFYVVGHIFALVLILVFNKKYMSGGRVKKFNKYPRFTLFLVSLFMYFLTMWVFNLFR